VILKRHGGPGWVILFLERERRRRRSGGGLEVVVVLMGLNVALAVFCFVASA
jgi:hypothetical protein